MSNLKKEEEIQLLNKNIDELYKSEYEEYIDMYKNSIHNNIIKLALANIVPFIIAGVPAGVATANFYDVKNDYIPVEYYNVCYVDSENNNYVIDDMKEEDSLDDNFIIVESPWEKTKDDLYAKIITTYSTDTDISTFLNKTEQEQLFSIKDKVNIIDTSVGYQFKVNPVLENNDQKVSIIYNSYLETQNTKKSKKRKNSEIFAFISVGVSTGIVFADIFKNVCGARKYKLRIRKAKEHIQVLKKKEIGNGMNYELLNKIINYLEENLINKIDYKKLAKNLGLNDFIMQRVFNIMAGISLAEYVRKRRLSKAYEELKLTNNKIIDIAVKYGYESSISFTRSFKKEFNITPSALRKNKNSSYKLFPKLIFGTNYENKDIISFEIKRIDSFTIYGNRVEAKTFDDLHYKIRELYRKLKKDKTYDLFNKNERYALTYTDNNILYYLVGSKYKDDDLYKYNVKSSEYAIFEVGNKEQKDIIKTIKYINLIWYNSSSLNVKDEPYLEVYKENNCFIYVPLEKRNKTDM